MIRVLLLASLLLWGGAADARWQEPRRGCGQWSSCYVRALSREHMSGMGRLISRPYWGVR
jgi:hypothetical protein